MLINTKVSLLKSYKDNYPTDHTLTPTELEKLLTTFIPSTKKNAPGIISGHFNHGRRISSNLHSKSLIFLDIDYYNQSIIELEELIKNQLGDYKFIAYSTASHTPEKARIRIALFLKTEVGSNVDSSMEDYKTIASNFIDSLDCELKRSIEVPSSVTPNHFMYLPVIPHDKYIPWSYINNGKFIDNEEFLSKTLIENKSDDPLLNIARNAALDISHDDIISCLQSYKVSECDYHQWREVGQALHHQYTGGSKGFKLWDKWSKSDTRPNQYQGTDLLKAKWNSFSLNKNNPLTFATILYKAKPKLLVDNSFQYNPIHHTKWAHTTGKAFNPIFSEENCHILFNEYKIKLKYDDIKKENIITFNGKTGNDDITRIKLLFSLNRLPTTNLVTDIIDLIAKENKFNSWKDWITSKPWDGVDRFREFCDTVTVHPNHLKIRDIYFKRWLIQMLHMTCLNDGISPKNCRMVLLFQGKQFIGKSTWLTSLAPSSMKDYIQIGKSLNSSNDMDILSCIKKVFVELGEITSTFRKSDIENLKNFISRPLDILNRKYKTEHDSHRRRTVFFGTTNESNFLSDTSGNSRFLVLPVLKCNAFHQIDMQQFYAQLLIEAMAIEDYNLLPEEYELQSKQNEEFENISALEEKFVDMFDTDNKECKTVYTATKVLEELGFNIAQMSHKKRITNEMGSILNKFNFRKNAYPRGWYLPPKRISDFDF
jgi:hypothetical protein